ncbi:TadE family type IV pilus minor pilin [Pseudonocardia sp.]|uniref:TadE family type IV pilus minor pilin n=1 Tax=Pseudonocardia sp. TaxID=60912 RepID=UPI003D0CA32B
MVTVEAAIALGGLVLVTVLAVAAVALAAASVRCTDAARELVRLAVRGEPDRGREIAARLAPAGAQIELQISGDEAVGRVAAAPSTLLPVRVAASAVGVLEPGALAVEAGAVAPVHPGDGPAPSAGGASPTTGAGVPPGAAAGTGVRTAEDR